MAVRVDREIFDQVGAGSTAGGLQIQENAPDTLPWQPRPFTTKTEYQVSEAMRLMTVPADVIRQTRPPFISVPFPEQFGYDQTPLTIQDVLDTDRWSPTIRSWVSGTPRAPRKVDQIEDQWSGTLRGIQRFTEHCGVDMEVGLVGLLVIILIVLLIVYLIRRV